MPTIPDFMLGGDARNPLGWELFARATNPVIRGLELQTHLQTSESRRGLEVDITPKHTRIWSMTHIHNEASIKILKLKGSGKFHIGEHKRCFNSTHTLPCASVPPCCSWDVSFIIKWLSRSKNHFPEHSYSSNVSNVRRKSWDLNLLLIRRQLMTWTCCWL